VNVNQRDGQGRLLQQVALLSGHLTFVETFGWRPDSTLSSYSGTRIGTGGWSDSRNFGYNTRNQLTNEPVGLATGTTATNNYSFDAPKLGVLTGIQLSGGLTNNWQATGLNAFSQVTNEAWNQSGLTLRAGGSAINASSVSALLDGGGISSSLGGGRWFADLSLSPGSHTLAATANYTVGQYAATATSGFTVVGANNVTNYYDAAGNVTNRLFANGKAQTLVWDAAGRLVSVIERTYGTNGFNWTAIYDALGRRLETVQVPVVNSATNIVMPLVLDSWFDPQVEFSEVGVAVNGKRTWKIIGPDGDHGFGSMQGVGGLEATVRESDSLTTPVLNDFSGNVLATISGTTANWNPVRTGGYGPEIGYEASLLTPSTPLVETLVWRSRRIDPTGFYWLGARYYDPMAGRFLSPDPLGHSASMDLYSFANGDPVNQFDADGRFGKGFAYGVGDVMEGGSYYKSFGNPHSGWSTAGYDVGLVAAEATKQVALYFATEGAFALMSRGLALGARALSAEMRVGEEALAGEVAASRTPKGAFGMGTEMGEAFATMSRVQEGAEGSNAGRLALGGGGKMKSADMTPAQVYEFFKNAPESTMAKTLDAHEISAFRELARLKLAELPGRAGFNADAPLFISKPNQGGGRVWFSTYVTKPFDHDALIRAGGQKGPITLITGVHGNWQGKWAPNPGGMASSRWYINNQGLNVDLQYFGNMTDLKLREVLNRNGTIVCGWCWSSCNRRLLDALLQGF